MKVSWRELAFVYWSNFCFFAAVAACLPFHILYMKQSGITASEIGVMTGITPILATLSSLLISNLADRFRAHQVMTQIMFALTAICFTLFLAVPVEIAPIACNGTCHNTSNVTSAPSSFSFEVSGSPQFWGFFILRLFGFLFFQPAFTLHTSLGLGATRGDAQKFARTRAFGNIGFLAIAAVQSVINQFVPPPAFLKHTVHLNFLASLIIFDVLLLISGVLLRYYDLPKNQVGKHSQNGKAGKSEVSRSRSGVFRSLKHLPVCGMLVVLLCSGFLFGILETYIYLYVEDFRPPALYWSAFLGISIISEIAVTWTSGWILSRISEANCIVIALLAYAVRFGVNGLLRSAWPILATQALNGFTFGLHFVAYTTFFNRHAPADSVATLQGVAIAAHFGFGLAAGGLFGGVVWANFGSSNLFYTASALSVLIALLYALFHNVFLRRCVSSAPRAAIPADASDHNELTKKAGDDADLKEFETNDYEDDAEAEGANNSKIDESLNVVTSVTIPHMENVQLLSDFSTSAIVTA